MKEEQGILSSRPEFVIAPPNAAKRMKELLQLVQAPVAGFVLNDRTALYSDTYGYYGKGYYGTATTATLTTDATIRKRNIRRNHGGRNC